MSSYRKQQRQEEVRLIRADARAAFLNGRSRESCPYDYMNKWQWQNEWDRMAEEAQREADLLSCSEFVNAVADEVLRRLKEGTRV